MDLRVDQRIEIQYQGDDKIADIISKHSEYIMGETLATKLEPVGEPLTLSFEIDKLSLTLSISPQ